MIMYENKGCEKKTYSKLMLSRLKVMGGSTFIYTPSGPSFKEAFIKVFMCALTKGSSKKIPNSKKLPCVNRPRKVFEKFHNLNKFS
jgi:hypothetical protein